jgi:hypothetical protein
MEWNLLSTSKPARAASFCSRSDSWIQHEHDVAMQNAEKNRSILDKAESRMPATKGEHASKVLFDQRTIAHDLESKTKRHSRQTAKIDTMSSQKKSSGENCKENYRESVSHANLFESVIQHIVSDLNGALNHLPIFETETNDTAPNENFQVLSYQNGSLVLM